MSAGGKLDNISLRSDNVILWCVFVSRPVQVPSLNSVRRVDELRSGQLVRFRWVFRQVVPGFLQFSQQFLWRQEH